MDINKLYIKYIASYSGYINGDLGEKGIWFCGIEPGGTYFPPNDLYKDFSKIDPIDKVNLKDDKLQHRFFQIVAKLFTVLHGEQINNYKETALTRKLFMENSNTCIFNLYPLHFKNTNANKWTPEHTQHTGIQNKNEYMKICEEHRFPLFRQLVEKHKPQCIICSGTSFEEKFIYAFIGKVKYEKKSVKLDKGNVLVINATNTIMFIMPFFSYPNLSHKRIISIAEIIRQSLN